MWTLSNTLLGAGHKWEELAAANPDLDPQADLKPGSRLRVPAEALPAASFAAAGDLEAGAPRDRQVPADASAERDQPTVTVQRGDSLWRIASRHLGDGERWPEIYRLNTDQIADPDQIDVGWVLRLPVAPTKRVEVDQPERPGPHRPSQQEIDRIDSLPMPPREPPQQTQPETAGGEQGPVSALAGDDAIDPALLLVGALGPMLAASVCTVLGVRREIQRWNRPPGRRVLHPDTPAARLESAMRATGDETQLDLTDFALRAVADHCRAFALPLPSLETLTVTPEGLRLAFADSPPPPPAGFVAIEGGWLFPRAATVETPGSEQPYPALMTLGRGREDESVLLNLEGGTLGIVGPEAAVSGVTRALTIELASTPWSGQLVIRATGDAGTLLRACGEAPEVPSPPALVAELETVVAARRAELAAAPRAAPHPRTDPDRREAWNPHVYVFASRLSPELLSRVETAVHPASLGVTAVLAGLPGDRTLHLEGDPDRPTAVVRPGGMRVAAQLVPEATAAAISQLHEAASSPDTTPAPWWDHTSTNLSVLTTPVTPKEPLVLESQGVLHPTLNLLGPIQLLGTTGSPPTRGQRTCMEYCGWLLEHPGSTAAAMANSLLVAESSRRSTMSRLRTWLGRSPEGDQYLPDAYSGRISLHPSVSSDWQQLQILVAPGVNRVHPQTLRTALSLVRGAPLADAAPGQWHWAEELRSDMAAMLRDIGLVLGDHALATGDVDLARWAAARALTACPEDEQLCCLRIRTEHRAGNRREVERLVLRITGHARRLGVDLDDDTVLLLQEVMEGHIRARTVTAG